MLVLTRNKNESIKIGDDVEVVVLDVRGDRVRLGIAAPADVDVHRREVWDKIKTNQGDGEDMANPAA